MKKRTAFFAAVLLCLAMLSGCGSNLAGKTVNDYKDITVATLGSDRINLAEVNYYLRDTQELYERFYSASTQDNIWNTEYSDTMTFGEYIRSVMINRVYQTHLLNSKAGELGVSLGEEEKQKVQDAVDSWLETASENMKEAVGTDRDTLVSIYENNALANLVYEAMVADVDRNVSDEEARQWSVSVVTLSGTSETYNAEEVKDQLMESVANGETLSDAAAALDLGISATSYTLGTDGYASSFGPTAVTMSTGETKEVYSESTGSWYVITCLDDFDEHATEHKKEDIIAGRQSELFQEKYAEYKATAPEFKVNEAAAGLLKFTKYIYEE